MKLALVLAVLCFGAVAVVVGLYWRSTRRMWGQYKPVPHALWGARAKFEPGANVGPEDVKAALHMARAFLLEHSPWKDEAALDKALKGLLIWVRAEESWDSFGRRVTGESNLDAWMVTVGPSLAALVHEVSHLVQKRLEARVDYDHTDWAQRGIYAAAGAYEAWAAEAQKARARAQANGGAA